MQWQIIRSEKMAAQAIMDKDTALLEGLAAVSSPILHFYRWQGPSLTYGYFAQPADFLNLDMLEAYRIQIARRPTGGGIIFHVTDLAFSVLIPACHPQFSFNTLDNYRFINQLTLQAIASFLPVSKLELLIKPTCQTQTCHAFCMANPTHYDIVFQGKKIGGAAQRRTKYGFLHQGSLLLTLPSLSLLQAVLKTEETVALMHYHSYPLLGQADDQTFAHQRQKIEEQLIDSFISS
jgi:lipoate---protein ligase